MTPCASISYKSFFRGPTLGLLDFFYIDKYFGGSELGTFAGVFLVEGNRFLRNIYACRDEHRGDRCTPISVSWNILFLKLEAYMEWVVRLLWVRLIQLQITFRFRDFEMWLHRWRCHYSRLRILRVPCVLEMNTLPKCRTLVGGWISVECKR
jgi:hypothetical protein